MKFDDTTWDKWVDWVEKIESDLMGTIDDQAVARRFRTICADNESWIGNHDGHYFCMFVLRCSGVRAALGIRRHLKPKGNSISMARFLTQIERCATQVTFEYYLQRFPRTPDSVDWQPKTFALLSEDKTTVSPAIVRRNLDELRQLNRNIEEYVDRALAHLDPHGLSSNVTFTEVENSLDHFNKLACRYICFFTGKGMTTSLEAVIQFDWENIFKVPLTEPT